MAEMTVADVIDALAKTQTVIVPIGGTEQHGYHMPLSTDSVQARFVARGVSERTGCVVAPCVDYSHSYGTLPGTTNIRPSTLALVLVDLGTSLHEQGFRTIVIYPCHLEASTLFAARESQAQLQTRLADACVVTYETPPAPAAIVEKLAADPDGHAGAGETSVMLHIASELVRGDRPFDLDERWWLGVVGKMHELDESGLDSGKRLSYVSPEDIAAGVSEAEAGNAPVRIGVFGDPNRARAEVGREICEWQIEQFAEFVRAQEAGQGRGPEC